jgi:2,3-dihydroxy-2,3-dihydrophenylpropionate dehydrogenase
VVARFVEEGAKVGVLELSPEKVQDLRDSFAKDDVVVTEGNATSMDDNDRAVADVVATFGSLNTVICCVGVFDYFTELPALPKDKISEAFDQIFSVNVKGTIMTVKAALDQLIANEGNVVLTVSSAGFYPGGGGPLYEASKFAVRGLVTELAYELAPKIRVNGVAPGGTLTEIRGIPALGNEGMALKDVPDIERMIAEINPLNFVAQPEDHSWTYAYLASKERSPGVTGTIIHGDGGLGVRGLTRMAGLTE